MAQWLRIHLALQRTEVRSLVRELRPPPKPTCHSWRVGEPQPQIPHAATETTTPPNGFFKKYEVVHIFSVQNTWLDGGASRFQNSIYRMILMCV